MDDKTELITFRVSKKEKEHILRVAKVLFSNHRIKSDTAGALARASTLVQVNQFIQLELMQEAVDQKEQQNNDGSAHP